MPVPTIGMRCRSKDPTAIKWFHDPTPSAYHVYHDVAGARRIPVIEHSTGTCGYGLRRSGGPVKFGFQELQ